MWRRCSNGARPSKREAWHPECLGTIPRGRGGRSARSWPIPSRRSSPAAHPLAPNGWPGIPTGPMTSPRSWASTIDRSGPPGRGPDEPQPGRVGSGWGRSDRRATALSGPLCVIRRLNERCPRFFARRGVAICGTGGSVRALAGGPAGRAAADGGPGRGESVGPGGRGRRGSLGPGPAGGQGVVDSVRRPGPGRLSRADRPAGMATGGPAGAGRPLHAGRGSFAGRSRGLRVAHRGRGA